MTKQPDWKLVANLGDVNPIDHGGFFVYVDATGVYPPEAELLESPDDDDGKWIVHRFILDDCTFQDGILSDNKFHPTLPAWFAKPFNPERPQDGRGGLEELSSFSGQTVEELVSAFLSPDARLRAFAWELVGQYHGFDNLDGYPLTLTRDEAEARYAGESVVPYTDGKLS